LTCVTAPWDNEAPGTFGIDFLIGEEAFLHIGFGYKIVKLIIDTVIRYESPRQLIADPVKENITSIKALLANGYVFEESTGLYKYKL